MQEDVIGICLREYHCSHQIPELTWAIRISDDQEGKAVIFFPRAVFISVELLFLGVFWFLFCFVLFSPYYIVYLQTCLSFSVGSMCTLLLLTFPPSHFVLQALTWGLQPLSHRQIFAWHERIWKFWADRKKKSNQTILSLRQSWVSGVFSTWGTGYTSVGFPALWVIVEQLW